MLLDTRGGNMAEAAITMPVVLLILVFAFSVSRAGYAALAARNAADYGARVGAVAGSNPEGYAKSAAKVSLAQSGVPGDFPVMAQVSGEGSKGVIIVTVGWTSPTILSGLCSLFGEGCPKEFHGEARAVWRREGWRK